MKKGSDFLSISLTVVLLWMTSPAFCRDRSQADDARKLFEAGQQLYDAGLYAKAADTLGAAVAMFEGLHDFSGLVRSMNLRGECYSNLNRCDDAGKLIYQSLSISIAKLGEISKETAETYYYLTKLKAGCSRMYDEAKPLMRKSTDIKQKLYGTDHLEIAVNDSFLGYIYNSQGKFDSALLFLNRALATQQKHLKPGSVEIANTLYHLANSYDGKSDLPKALTLQQQALQVRMTEPGELNASASNNINALGRIYRKLGNNERALEYYQKALEIRKRTLGPTHPNVAASYYEIGNLYNAMSNTHESISYIQEGNRILESNSQMTIDVLPTYYALTGKLYGLNGDQKSALEYVDKAVRVAEQKLPPDHAYLAITYNLAGEYFSDASDATRALGYFTKATAIYRRAYGEGSEREGDMIAKMAALQAKQHNRKEAELLFEKALTIYTAKLGTQHPKVAGIHLSVGDLLAAEHEYTAALKSFQTGMDVVDPDHRRDVDQIENKSLALRIAKGIARVQLLRGKAERDADYLNDAFQTYQFALAITEAVSDSHSGDKARLKLEEETRLLYTQSMDACWLLYEMTGDESTIAKAFELTGMSKATLLSEGRQDLFAKRIGGVPDSLVAVERDLKVELTYYRNNLRKALAGNDSALKITFNKSVFDTQRKLEKFKKKLERAYPSYYQAKYARHIPSVNVIRQELANPHTMLIEYFVGDTSIYRFLVSKESVNWNKGKRNEKFNDVMSDYHKSLTDADYIINQKEKADSLYLSSAREFYSLLLLPDPEQLAGVDNLIVVPDNILAQVNFGTLLYQKSEGSAYPDLPYLSRACRLSYAFTSSSHDKQHIRHSSSGAFAGFAPSYQIENYASVSNEQHPMTLLAMRDGNLPLPGAEAEVKEINSLMKGRSWIKEEATETNFKVNSGDYNILHLAMHSLLNNEDPGYSELLFNPKLDTTNDGYLTISEIYNLKLNAQLVVLSACSSGTGKIEGNDGPISLSRAFSYAGCPSVVMSLWKSPDEITAVIMKHFYEGLRNGLTKDEALRTAQLKFLAEADDPLYQHPFFWAGFVVTGDTSAIQTPHSPIAYYILAAMLIGLIVPAIAKEKFQFMSSRS